MAESRPRRFQLIAGSEFLSRNKYGAARRRRVIKNKSVPVKKPLRLRSGNNVNTTPAVDAVLTPPAPLLITRQSARVE